MSDVRNAPRPWLDPSRREPQPPPATGEQDPGHSTASPARSASRLQGWKPYPKALLDDASVRPHHHAVILATLALTSISQGSGPYTAHVRTVEGLTSRVVARLAGVGANNAGTYLAELERFGHLKLEWCGRMITGIAWDEQHLDALLTRNPFIRVPRPILCDYALSPRLKQTYVALRWTEFRYPHGSEEFFPAVTILAELMHVASRSTVRACLRELKRLRLIESGTSRPRNQIQPLRFVPPEVRYVRIDSQGKRLFGGIPTHLPLVACGQRHAQFVQNDRRIEEVVWKLGEQAPPSAQVFQQRYWEPILTGIDRSAEPTDPTWRSTTSNLENDPSNLHVDHLSLNADHSKEVEEGSKENQNLNYPPRARVNDQLEGINSQPKSARELTDYLRDKLREQHARLGNPDWLPKIKAPAVGSQIKANLDSGVEPETVKEMIDIFTASEGYHRPGTPPWLMFIEQQNVLLAKALRSVDERPGLRETTRWLDYEPPNTEGIDWLEGYRSEKESALPNSEPPLEGYGERDGRQGRGRR